LVGTHLISRSSEKEASDVFTFVLALEPSDTRKPFTKGSLVLVNVRGLLAELCKGELRFGDQIQIEGVLRARAFPTASGVHRIVHEIEAFMIIPVHPEDLS
jgi:hypothetical protein